MPRVSSPPSRVGRARAPLRLRGAAPRVRARRLRRPRAAGRGRASWTPRDRALAMRLAYGAVQRRGTLDHLIERLAERPAGRARPAACSRRCGSGCTSCSTCAARPTTPSSPTRSSSPRRTGAPGHGLVNAVLRRAAREGPARCSRRSPTRRPSRRRSSTPTPSGSRACGGEALGAEQARALMACDNEPGELALRANTLVTDAADAGRASCRVAHAPRPRHPGGARAGGARSTCTARRCGARAPSSRSRARRCSSRARSLPRPGERVLDLCAAPGGKSTHLAALMEGGGEVAGGRAQPAPGRRARAHRAAAARGERPRRGRRRRARSARDGPGFDRVLVDPPCSGLGTLQARADLRWRVTPDAIARDGARAGARSSPPAPAPSVRAACLSTLRARSPRPRTSA